MNVIVLLITFFSCINENNTAKKQNEVIASSNKITCDSIQVNKTLKQLAMDFTPNSIDINKSMSNELNLFLSKSDSDCIKSNSNYKFFICLVLLKQCYYHKKEYHLSYNLRSMKLGTAKFIIAEYENISQDHDEFLSSYSVLNYSKTDSTLMNDREFRKFYDKTEKLFSN